MALTLAAACSGEPASPGPSDAAPGVDAAPVCTSGVHVDANRQPGADMMPGHTCIACHAAENAASGEQDAPVFAFAGTVYPSVHEPDLCAGTDAAGAQVVVTDARGRTIAATVNQVGNFFADADEAFAPPFRAEVRFAGRTRAMQHVQSDGDCNGCHTVDGTAGAPGRIALP